MTFDGFTFDDTRRRAAFQSTFVYATKLTTFHVSEIAEHLYAVEGWPSYGAAVEGMWDFIRRGKRAGWIVPHAPNDGFYCIKGYAHPPITARACV